MHLSFIRTPLIKAVVLLLFCLQSIQTISQIKNEKALLWEISGNGLEKPSYIYGTMHVSNRIAFHLPESFFNALKRSDMVALEINPDNFVEEVLSIGNLKITKEWQYAQGDNMFFNSIQSKSNSDKLFSYLLSKEDRFADYLLYRSDRGNQDFQEDTYLDLFIYQSGKKLGKKVAGLEKLSETFDLAMKAEARSYGVDKDDYEYRWEGNPTIDLEKAYRAGNLQLIDSISRGTETIKSREYMLIRRNEIMVDRMDSLFKTNTLFAGVGAGHLPGEKGMLNLLIKKGYSVKPVYNDGSRSAMKEKLEKEFYKNQFTKQYSQDSLFEIAVPGKLFISPDFYGTKNLGSIQEMFAADMVNGGFYSIIRTNLGEAFEGSNQEDYLKKIDSVLFENIPGKIVRKKRFTEGRLIGLDISNVTKSGNKQRYKIYFTPLEIIVFKISGIKDYTSKVSDVFFNSIKFRDTHESWHTITQPVSGLKISVPGYYITQDNKIKEKQNSDFSVHSIQADKDVFLFGKSSFHEFNNLKKDSLVQIKIARNYFKNYDYTLNEKKYERFKGKQSVTFRGSASEKKDVFFRIIQDGTVLYFLACNSKDSTERITFFNSLELAEKKYSASYQKIEDTVGGFTVNSPVKPIEKSFTELNMNHFLTEEQKNKQKYVSSEEKFYFVNAQTSEAIEVVCDKLSDFFSIDKNEFWKRVKDFHTNKGKLKVVNEKWNGANELFLTIGDTGTVMVIKKRILLAGNRIYTISTDQDSTQKESEFVTEFFKSFTPKTTEGNIFSDKTDNFYKAWNSSDTLLVNFALESISDIKIKEEGFEKLKEILESQKFKNIAASDKSLKNKLIGKIASIDSPASHKYLKDLYSNSSDSVAIQLVILEALAKNKTKTSYKVLAEMLHEEVPLGQEYRISSLFKNFHDTLLLSRSLYPDLLKLTRYKEYKDPVYRLLAALKDSNLVTTVVYEQVKADIIKDANEELKRKTNNSNDYSFRNKSSDNLTSYYSLLVNYYSEPSVKSLFDKSLKISDKDVVLSASFILAKSNMPVEDSIWLGCIKKDDYRIITYKKLKQLNKVDKFDATYFNQELFCKSILNDNYNSKETDSVVFIAKKQARIGNETGYVYFFKRKKAKDKNWKLEYVGLQPLDSSRVNSDYTIRELNVKFNEKDLDKKIEECLEEVEFPNDSDITFSYYKNAFLDYIESNRDAGTFEFDPIESYDYEEDYDYYMEDED